MPTRYLGLIVIYYVGIAVTGLAPSRSQLTPALRSRLSAPWPAMSQATPPLLFRLRPMPGLARSTMLEVCIGDARFIEKSLCQFLMSENGIKVFKDSKKNWTCYPFLNNLLFRSITTIFTNFDIICCS